MTTKEIIDVSIKISEDIVNKLQYGFVFDNKDYCKLYATTTLYHIIKNLNNLDLSDEVKEKVLTLYNKILSYE